MQNTFNPKKNDSTTDSAQNTNTSPPSDSGGFRQQRQQIKRNKVSKEQGKRNGKGGTKFSGNKKQAGKQKAGFKNKNKNRNKNYKNKNDKNKTKPCTDKNKPPAIEKREASTPNASLQPSLTLVEVRRARIRVIQALISKGVKMSSQQQQELAELIEKDEAYRASPEAASTDRGSIPPAEEPVFEKRTLDSVDFSWNCKSPKKLSYQCYLSKVHMESPSVKALLGDGAKPFMVKQLTVKSHPLAATLRSLMQLKILHSAEQSTLDVLNKEKMKIMAAFDERDLGDEEGEDA